MAKYAPQKGDFIVVTFNPQSGHEQKGRRPALVISNDLFNKRTGLALVCPITNTDSNYPFHGAIPESSALSGYIMVEQVKLIDNNTRKAKFIEKAPVIIINEVLSLLDAVIY